MLTLGNPITSSGSMAIEINNRRVDLAGRCLSTGLKGDANGVVSAFIGAGLNDKALILGKIKDGTLYSSNILTTAKRSLEQMASTLTDMLSVISQSTGASESNLKTLQDIFDKKLAQLSLQRKSAEFDGSKLLLGKLGSDPSVTAKFDTKAVSVKSLNNGTIVKAAGTKGVNTLTVDANTAVGEIVQFGGVKFEVVSNDPSSEGEFKLGSTIQETARNLASAILNSKDEGLKKYSVHVDGADVVVTQISASSEAIPLQGSANIANVVTTAGTQGGINLDGIRNIEGFINAPTAKFEVIQQVASANGDNAARGLGVAFGSAQAAAANSANGDRAAALKVNIDGKDFTGTVFYSNGGNMNDRVLKMTHAATGESFTLETHAAFANGGDIDTPANAAIFATALSDLFAESRFNQTRVLDVNTDQGSVFNESGTKIASMKGFTTSLTSTDFSNKKFTDFKIENVGGDVRFTAYVENNSVKQEFTTTVAAADIATLVQGAKLDLTDAKSGDVLSFNLGEIGLTSLSDVKNHSFVEKAYKNSLLQVGSGLDVRVGLEFDDVINVSISNISEEKLFVDDSGKYVSDLSILDESVAKTAQEVVQNALDFIRNEQAKVQAQKEIIDGASMNLQTLIDTTQESADSYLKADMVESAREFSESLKKIMAAVSTIISGNKPAEAAQQLLNSGL